MSQTSTVGEYYVISLKYSIGSDYIVLWRPNDAGYTVDLDQAGRYSQAQIDEHPSYYDNRKGTLAVPCDELDRRVRRVVSDDILHQFVLKEHGVDWGKVLDANGRG